MYIRLSNEDADITKNAAKIESNSVGNQRDLLKDFILHHPVLAYSTVVEFCDDGYSGTNFERPAIEKLLAMVRQGEIDCIIVKDFSRFGRNYLELGDYIEQVFPFLGVRFISINDGYDSAKDNGITAGLDIGLKNLIYDLYSKDLSLKVKSANLAKMKKGEFLGAFAPYGYIKSKDKKNSLVVDGEAENIIKRIFQLANEGNNTSAIAKMLNAEGVLSPARHFHKNHGTIKFTKAKGNLLWQYVAILRILRDETYTGKTVNHRRETPDVNSKSTIAVPREQWIVVPGTHEAIVSEELFKEAQNAIRKKSKRKNFKIDNTRVLNSKVKCGFCKKYLQRLHSKMPYYICRTNYFVHTSQCFNEKIKESVILEIVLEAIQQQALIANKAEEIVIKVKEKTENEVTGILQDIRKAQQRSERLNVLNLEEYEKYLDGEIVKDEYLKQRASFNKEIEETKNKINKLETDYELQSLKSKESENQFVEHFKGKQEIKELSRELVDELVDSIYVFGENRIEIVWKFSDNYDRILEIL